MRRDTLSLRDLPEMFLERGIVFTHEAVRDWEAQFASLLSETLRKHRRVRIGPSWYIDETSINVKGRWTYLYRAIDHKGNLVDILLSEKRTKRQQKTSFALRDVSWAVSRSVSPPMAMPSIPGPSQPNLGEAVRHRTNRYLNNYVEQDHRAIKQRTRPMGGLKSVDSATRFCRVHDEVRNFLRPRSKRNERVSLAQRRILYTARTRVLLTALAAA